MAYGELNVTPEVTRHAPAAPEEVRSASQLPREVDPGVLERYPGLQLRTRRRGDRIRLAAGSKLLSDLLIDLKVPAERRGELRVLASGSEVLWVEGVAVAHGAAAEGVPDVLDDDRRFMRAALEQALKARELGEVPIGAVVVSAQGEILSAAHNLTETNSDATAHAELLALQAAGRATGDWRLAGATLYVTLEPCPMCLGAVLQTQLARVVYGADNHRDGALGGVTDLLAEGWKRVPAVEGGVEATASERLLKHAFEAGRGQGRVDGEGGPPPA